MFHTFTDFLPLLLFSDPHPYEVSRKLCTMPRIKIKHIFHYYRMVSPTKMKPFPRGTIGLYAIGLSTDLTLMRIVIFNFPSNPALGHSGILNSVLYFLQGFTPSMGFN